MDWLMTVLDVILEEIEEQVDIFVIEVIKGIFMLVVIAIISLVAAIPTYYLWNWLMPTIFSITIITFWQAWGVNLLAGILFKSTFSYTKSRD